MNITNSRLHKTFTVRLYAALTIAALLLSALPLNPMVVEARSAEIPSGILDANTQVDLCHNNNGASDYSLVQAKASSIVDGENSGHPETDAVHIDDIIPPFDYDFGTASGTFPGRNWNAGKDTFLNDCKVPGPTSVEVVFQKKFSGSIPDGVEATQFTFDVEGEGEQSLTGDEDYAEASLDLEPGVYNIEEILPDGQNPDAWRPYWSGACEADDTNDKMATLTITEDDLDSGPIYCEADNTYRPIQVEICDDPEANNYGEAAECTYDTDMTFELVKKFSGPVPVGYTADQFSFNIAGVASDIPLTPRTDIEAFATVTLGVGSYDLTENGPDGFVADDWTILWSGAGCENITADGTTITIEQADLSKDNFNCVADNQWKPSNTDVPGCTDQDANNYNADATYDDGSCDYDDVVLGCTDPEALNYNENATSGNPDAEQCEYDTPNQCVATEAGWAEAVHSTDQGETKSVGPITNPNRTDPTEVLGAADWTNGGAQGFYSLGFGGSIVVTFGPDGYVTDGEGDDISIHEATNGDTYPEEKALVEVSQDGESWYEVGTASNLTDLTTRVSYFDIATTGLSWIKYVRVTDTSDADLHVPAGDGFDLDAVDATGIVCEQPDGSGDNGDGDEPTYLVFGYVWHDENENQIWDGVDNENESETTEPDLSGWTVTIKKDGESHSTVTDENGYYEFWVPAGTWTISEGIENGWTITYPTDNSHVVEVIDETLTAAQGDSFFAMVMDYIIPTAHAQTPTTYGSYNFGNVYTGSSGGSSSGGGGGSPAPRCEVFTAEIDGDEIKFAWETRHGRDMTIDADGVEVYDETDDDVIEEGSTTIDNDGQTSFELTVYKGTRHDECVVDLSDSASTAGTPVPQVLGEQVSVVPVGAPDAGAGGTSPLIPSPAPWVAMLATLRKQNAK